MKKIITAVAVILFFGGTARAEKTITFSDINFAMVRVWVITPLIQIGTETFHPKISFAAIVKTTSPDGYTIPKSTTVHIRLRKVPPLAPYTLREKMQDGEMWDSLGKKIRKAVKYLGKEAVNVDYTQ